MSLVRNSDISYPLCPHPLRSQTETSAYFLKVKYKFQKSNLNFGELKQKNSKSPENTTLLCAKQWIWKINQQLEKPERKQQLPFWTTLSVFANPLQPAAPQRLRLCTPAKRPSCAALPEGRQWPLFRDGYFPLRQAEMRAQSQVFRGWTNSALLFNRHFKS